MTDLGTLPGIPSNMSSSEALSINSSGAAVGDSNAKAILFQDGKVIDLNTLIPASLEITLDRAIAINDLGQILVQGISSSGMEDSLILTSEGMQAPVAPDPIAFVPQTMPEPTTLFAFGLMVIVICQSSRGQRSAVALPNS